MMSCRLAGQSGHRGLPPCRSPYSAPARRGRLSPRTRAVTADDVLTTLQEPITSDAAGTIQTRQVSVFQVIKDPKYRLDDMLPQYRYIGVAAPTS
jgi:hypothetical protein